MTEEEFDRVYRVNVKSEFHMHECATPVFNAQGGGVYINIASTTGVRPGPGLCWYSGSKAAMINITKGLALELAKDNIRARSINPMIGETAMLEQFMGMPDTPENRERFLARIPLGRFTRPLDVAHAAVYLGSDESSFLTGVCLDVDGGRNISSRKASESASATPAATGARLQTSASLRRRRVRRYRLIGRFEYGIGQPAFEIRVVADLLEQFRVIGQ